MARIGKAIVDIGAVEVQPPAGSIGGTVFADANANGKLDVGEKGIANIKVYLDANKNGLPDASEVSLLTDASGNFKFTNLPAGTFRVREVLPAGNALIAPVAGFFDIPLVLGASSVGSLFADAAATASIKGRVFGDSNSNGPSATRRNRPGPVEGLPRQKQKRRTRCRRSKHRRPTSTATGHSSDSWQGATPSASSPSPATLQPSQWAQ